MDRFSPLTPIWQGPSTLPLCGFATCRPVAQSDPGSACPALGQALPSDGVRGRSFGAVESRARGQRSPGPLAFPAQGKGGASWH